MKTHKQYSFEILTNLVDGDIEDMIDFEQWLQQIPIQNGCGRFSEYYSYNDNYKDDILVWGTVKLVKNKPKYKNKFMGKLKCFFNYHDWLHDKPTIVKCNRVCRVCGKKEHSVYDMMGNTEWKKGKYW